ncbi:MAG TPA: hypothetical protein VNM24_03610 [Burkholderiales bacterium]|nr:hypothetical protein [Burkholderiales bacterium]
MQSKATTLPRRLLRWSVWTLAAAVLSLLLGLLYVSLVGIPVDASALREPVARAFSETVGREVRLEGAMRLEISGRPKLTIGAVSIANPEGFGARDFARLGEARLALDLWQLMHRRLHVDELSGRDVQVRLVQRAAGDNNWTFQLPAADRSGARPQRASTSVADLPVIDIDRVSLEGLKVEYVTREGVSHYFDLHALSAKAPADEALTMKLTGTVEKVFPYQIELAAGPLQDLLRAEKPWPLRLTLTFLSSSLTLEGALTGASGDLRFGLGTETLTEFERLFQTRLPALGATALAGRIVFDPRKVTVSRLVGVMGNTTLSGELEFDTSGARPTIRGALALPSLDLRPFLLPRPEDPKEAMARMAAPPRSLADTYRELSQVAFSLSQLNDLDADLTLSVGNWLNLPGDVKDAALQVKLEQGRLEVPIRATVTGVALAGRAHADATTTPPRFAMSLATRESDLGGLAELLTGLPGIKGRVGRFELRVGAQGDQVSELVQSLDVRLEIERGHLSYGNIEGGRPVAFDLDKFAIALPSGQSLRGNLRGTLLGRPVQASLSGGALEAMMLQGRSPIDFNLESGQLRARVHGLLERPALERGPQIAFELAAPRASAAASWLGFTPDSQASIHLSGRVWLRSRSWRAERVRMQIGRSAILAEVAQTFIGQRPLIQAKLSADNIDVAEIESLLPRSEQPRRAGPVLDIPILPRGIDLTDSDVQVRLARFEGSPLEIRDVSFDGRIREGYMHPSTFAVKVGDAAFSGAILLDLRAQEPEARLWLAADDVDIGALLRRLDLVTGLDARLDLMRLYLATRSSRLGDMLSRADLTGTFAGGRLTLRDPNTRAEARIGLHTGLLRAEPGAPLRLTLNGSLDDIPVSVGLETAPARDLADTRLRIPFKLTAEAAQTRLALAGAVARPLGNKDVELTLDLQGSRLSALDRLVRASLPPWGPWSASGKFRMSAAGYEVADLRLQIGDSVLTGNGKLETVHARPRLEVALAAPNIQLDDFRFDGWSPVESKPAEADRASARDVREKAVRATDEAQRLLSPAVLRRQDAFLSVRVDQVFSGRDKLGSGRLDARLENGRADIGPIEVEIPGGSATVSLGYEPTEQDVRVGLRIQVRRFDYGILARRIKPDTDLRGTFSVDLDVTSRARYLSEVLRHGNGRLDFAVWPENMKAGIFDLWAVNVLIALVPAVDPEKQSRVNCAIGRFELTDGRLVDRAIVLDTSRMRVIGTGHADFKTEQLRLRLRPRSKTAQFLSLATPIGVNGSFTEFSIGVSPGDVVETVGRMATSVIWVPLQKLFGSRIPRDGSDVCSDPFSLQTRR